MNSIFCCLCKKLIRNKRHAQYDEILDKGDKKIKSFINAEYIFEVLRKH